jgi:LacI family repressor for deo operon, udp, cdd, tsx, nupC, and nupG
MATLTDRVKNHVLEAISAGKFDIGEVLPATEEIAEKVKCSTGTVRKALTDLANEGVLKRIQRRGTVVARKPSTGHVCLILPPEPHTNLLLHHVVHSKLVNAGYEVDTVPTTMGVETVKTQCAQLLSSGNVPDCLVVLETSTSLYPMIEELSKHCARRVIFQFDNQKIFQDMQLLTLDHQRAARDIVQHLLSLGHKKVAIVAGGSPGEATWSADAAAHCRDLLEVAGAQFVPFYLFTDRQPKLIEWFLKENVTAYWGVTDHEATQVVNLCYQAGLNVPKDVSIIGRNDTPWALDCHPPLTTLSLNPEGVANAIVDALAGQRKDPQLINKGVRIQPKLIVRESTGPARKN